MKQMKFWGIMMSAVTVFSFLSCGGDDETPVYNTVYSGYYGTFYELCQRAGISEDDYEWWHMAGNDDYLVATGYKKGTEDVCSWYLDNSTKELCQYSCSMPRTFVADLGYGEYATLEILPGSSYVYRVCDVDGNHVMEMAAWYHANGGSEYGGRHRIFILRPDNISTNLCFEELQGDDYWYNRAHAIAWYNNSVAVCGIHLGGTTVFSSNGNKITSFPYGVTRMTDEQKAKMIEIYDYDKALTFGVMPQGDAEGRHEIIIEFIDFSQSQTYDAMMCVQQAVFLSPVSSDDSRTKYAVEVTETNSTYCKVRMTLTEYSGRKKTFNIKIDKTAYTAEVI